MSGTSRCVVITGASSGIGEACALRLDRAGWRVFASVRREEDGRRLAGRASERLRWLPLEVTEPATIRAAADRVAAEVGAVGLHALVNNAGIATGGPLEFIPIETLRRQFEVNVLGVLAVTQAFLPLLRAARGRIVNVGSIAGRVASPMVGPYCASKHALEALSDALRLELSPWGIRTVVIEPGVVLTPIWDKGARSLEAAGDHLPPAAAALYASHLTALRRLLRRAQRDGLPADRVARTIEEALTSRRPRLRYVVGRDARLRLLLQQILPRRWMDALVLRVLRRIGGVTA